MITMKSFVWSDIYETGVELVDDQHQKLVELINQFGSLLTQNQVRSGDILQVLKQLLEYAKHHFNDEETYMAELKIDARHFNPHVDAHNAFLEEVGMLYAGFDSENIDAARHLLEFLIHWLAYHILGIDQNMAQQLKAIRSGVAPDIAYENGERERDKSTVPLLEALNGLFHQVSIRNKELLQLNQSLEQKVAQRTQELSDMNRHLEELSLTDVLTGLPNRRHAMRSLINLWQESIDYDLPLVCMMIDADHFKQVNDNYGHDAGDQVLIELACTLRDAFRSDDVVCRLGGDEFLVICPDTSLEGGLHVARQVQEKVSNLKIATGEDFWQGSISVGVAARNDHMTSHEELLKQADLAVYEAKRAGKNCVKSVGT
jgi:diguanylate cyclase (GGDEF)-like protein/hemerythrin-like metal-binding protein